MSKTAVKVISKDGEIIHKDLKTVAKEVGENRRHPSLECRVGGGGGAIT